jgi:outer membrane protein assembly factor BamB
MEIILAVVLTVLLSCAHEQPKENEKITNPIPAQEECSNLYPFQKDYINLDTYETIVTDGTPAIDFKTCSKFAHRFINRISDKVQVNGRTYTVEKNKDKGIYRINISEGDKIVGEIQLPVQKPLPEVHEYYIYLLPYKNDVIMFMEDRYTTHYMICKYNSDGKEIMRKEIEHTYVTHPEPNTNYYHRYLYYSGITTSQMIFTSHIAFAEKFKTIVLSMDDFSVAEYDQSSNGIILDKNEEHLAGFVSQKDDIFEVVMLDKTKYTFELKNGDPACDFILKDSLLYIANYHPIATGSSLHCFDLRTGKMKWTADVKQINASHSEYSNKVTLSMYKNTLIMEGDEESGDYVQLFDASTGKRLAVFGSFLNIE